MGLEGGYELSSGTNVGGTLSGGEISGMIANMRCMIELISNLFGMGKYSDFNAAMIVF